MSIGRIHVDSAGMSDKKGELETIKQNFNTEMETLRNIVDGTITSEDWLGEDAETFVTTTKAKLDDVRQKYETYITELENAIDSNIEKFTQVQQHNINMIN